MRTSADLKAHGLSRQSHRHRDRGTYFGFIFSAALEKDVSQVRAAYRVTPRYDRGHHRTVP